MAEHHKPDKRSYWPLIDGVPLNFILSLKSVRVWLLGTALVFIANSGWFPPGSVVMNTVGALMILLGMGGTAAARPPRPAWTLDQYNQWRLAQGLPLMTVDEWNKRRGLSGAYDSMPGVALQPAAAAPPPPPPPPPKPEAPTQPGKNLGARSPR